LVNLEESEISHRGEVPCIISQDCNGNPFVSEVLPLEANELTSDKLKILYLKKSMAFLKQEDNLLLDQLLQEIKIPETHRRQVMSVEEELHNPDKPTKIVDCFAKKYKPVALKVKPVLGTLPERFRITKEIIGDLLKNMSRLPECQVRGRTGRSGPELSGVTPEWKGFDNKVGEQPWPQLVRCASICCHMCSCVFQED